MKMQFYNINIAQKVFKHSHYLISKIPTVANVKLNFAQKDNHIGSNFIVWKKKAFGEYI